MDWLVNFSSAPESEPPASGRLPEESEAAFRKRVRDLPEEERGKVSSERQRTEREKMTDLRFWWLNRMLTSERPVSSRRR